MTNSVKRVVVADDSSFLRELLSSYLNSSPELEVIGTACNGQEALDLVHELQPDVVTLDVDMPVLSGPEVLIKIMQSQPTPTVMVSGVSSRSAEITMQAVKDGAVDFILKYVPGQKVDPEAMRLDVIAKVKAAASVKVIRTLGSRIANDTGDFLNHERKEQKSSSFNPPAPTRLGEFPQDQPQKLNKVNLQFAQQLQGRGGHWGDTPSLDIVVIGASTGGPVCVKNLLRRLPIDFPFPIVVVQHMPKPFTDVFAAQVNSQTSCRASVVRGSQPLLPGHVHIAPGDQHLILATGTTLDVNNGPEIGGHRPSIDVTMSSIAQRFPGRIYGILMTGMGKDGASGLAYIHSKGGRTFAQSADTCVVNGMPQCAIDMEVVDFIGSPEIIADQLMLDILHRQMQQQINVNPGTKQTVYN
jgi:two-component system, chemotaxis family, protein-glutamate methylesterase/glutaminase